MRIPMLFRIYGPPRITLVLPRAEAKAGELSISDQNVNLIEICRKRMFWIGSSKPHLQMQKRAGLAHRLHKALVVKGHPRRVQPPNNLKVPQSGKVGIQGIHWWISWYFMNFRMKQEVSYVEWDGFTWWKRGLWSLKPWVKSVWRWFFGFFFFIGGWLRQR